MTERTGETSSWAGGTIRGLPAVWAMAAAVSVLGSWMLFDALPGVNWLIWTTAAVGGLVALARRRGRDGRAIQICGAAAVLVAGSATVTASESLNVLALLATLFLLALQMLLSAAVSIRRITPLFVATAPLVALRGALLRSLRLSVDATARIRQPRARAWVRGLVITAPVVIAFALLLSGADPLFALWRDAVGDLLSGWEFLPRLVFFVALLAIVLGAYGFASAPPPAEAATAIEGAPTRWLGSTERLMLLASVAALFWLFLVLQLGYLFGNPARMTASGVSFAEYARRGFAEMSIVASASALLIVLSERYGRDDGRERLLRVLTFTVIAAVLLLLGSAFRRVWLYEVAYGFTTARLYAQVYMCAVSIGLLLLAREALGAFDAGRLFRRSAGAATILFIGLLYWNHEGWIASRNIDRFARTGQLDVDYLSRHLSADAIPAIAAGIPTLPEPVRSQLSDSVHTRYAQREGRNQRSWYEWNVASSRARRALEQVSIAGSTRPLTARPAPQ
jgi:hypothetical protein